MPNDTNLRVAINDETDSDTSAATDVYAVHGADPEVLAYGMAKYSRSSLSLRESLAELNEQKAEKFLNTFYFQYGHRSIADLAHLAFAIEKLSILAATVLVDETALGRAGAFHPLSGLPEERLLRSRFCRRCRGARSFIATQSIFSLPSTGTFRTRCSFT